MIAINRLAFGAAARRLPDFIATATRCSSLLAARHALPTPSPASKFMTVPCASLLARATALQLRVLG